VAKRCEIGLRLLLITNSKSHIGFQMARKSSILNDLEDQYYNRNCIGCSTSSLATAWFSCYALLCNVYTRRLLVDNAVYVSGVRRRLQSAFTPRHHADRDAELDICCSPSAAA